MKAAEDGRPSAQSQLREIQSKFSHSIPQPSGSSYTPPINPPAPSSSSYAFVYPTASSSSSPPVYHAGYGHPPYQTLVHPPMQLPPPAHSAQPSTASQSQLANKAAFLGSIREEIEALHRVDGIREAIAQVESGRIQELRNRYGPKSKTEHGKYQKAHVQWDSMKNIISRRERLHTQLTKYFGGDQDNFWAFFTIPASTPTRLRPMRPLVEAITRMEDNLKMERRKIQYHTASGEFSDALWKSVWEERNDWEVWRALGLEKYGK